MSDYIDLTPTWSAMVNTMIFCIENSSNKEPVKQELRKMAELADKYNELVRSNTNKD